MTIHSRVGIPNPGEEVSGHGEDTSRMGEATEDALKFLEAGRAFGDDSFHFRRPGNELVSGEADGKSSRVENPAQDRFDFLQCSFCRGFSFRNESGSR